MEALRGRVGGEVGEVLRRGGDNTSMEEEDPDVFESLHSTDPIVSKYGGLQHKELLNDQSRGNVSGGETREQPVGMLID